MYNEEPHQGGRQQPTRNEVELASDEELVELDEEQMKYIADKQIECREHAKVLTKDDIQNIIIDFDFDERKIDEYLESFKSSGKYQGLEQYEW